MEESATEEMSEEKRGEREGKNRRRTAQLYVGVGERNTKHVPHEL